MASFLKSAPIQAAAARALAWYIHTALRLQAGPRLVGWENLLLLARGAPMIAAFWHETLPCMQLLWREARRAGMTRPASVLASRHRDGQLIGNIARGLGVGVVSGSSTRGGAAGTRELVRVLEGGGHIGITPDGPRGPARRAAPGVAALAGLTGARILPCAAAASRFVTLWQSWDQMRVPLPFGRVALVCGPPIAVPRQGWRSALPEIEAALDAARARAWLEVRE